MKHMVQKRNNIQLDIVSLLSGEESHVRKIASKLNQPHVTISRRLKDLEQQNIVQYRTEGKNKIYSLKKNILAKKYLINSENHRLITTIEKYPFLEPVFTDILDICDSPLIIMFGSFARHAATDDSDIDIYIETEDTRLKKRLEMIDSRLSIKTGVFDQSSLLVREIIKHHVIVRGAEIFYEKLDISKQAEKEP